MDKNARKPIAKEKIFNLVSEPSIRMNDFSLAAELRVSAWQRTVDFAQFGKTLRIA
jgi:hypothetical protein